MVSERTYEQMDKLYPHACGETERQCDLGCWCSTCMHMVYPSDFEDHHWVSFCTRKRKEESK